MEGAISVNSEPITANEMQRISGFVHQEDVIMDTMTVREALTFSAMMRLPQDMERGAKVGPRRSRAAASARRPPLPVHLPGSAARHGLMLAPPRRLPAVLQVQRALDVAELLGLTHALDTAVGSAMIKGISGGEKRRWGLQAGWIRLAAPPQARGAAQRAALAALSDGRAAACRPACPPAAADQSQAVAGHGDDHEPLDPLPGRAHQR